MTKNGKIENAVTLEAVHTHTHTHTHTQYLLQNSTYVGKNQLAQ